MNGIPHTRRYLVFVSDQVNSNKFYQMEPLGNGMWKATWGRVQGGSGFYQPRSCNFEDFKWDQKYAEKIRKGYTDISDIFFADGPVDEDKTDTKDGLEEEKPTKTKKSTVALRVMKMLAELASSFIRSNYVVSADHITAQMVHKGNEILSELYKVIENMKKDDEGNRSMYLTRFNELLRSLFTAIPRAMNDSRNHFAHSIDDFDRIYKREYEYLDTLSGMVGTDAPAKQENQDEDDIERAVIKQYGLKISDATDKDVEKIKKLMGGDAYHFSRAWRVTNKETKEAFDKYKDTVPGRPKLLFHGSASRNFHSILCRGLKLNPGAGIAITGKMFGYGLYFSDSCGKSMGYTDLDGSRWRGGSSGKGYLAVYEVAMGDILDVDSYIGNYGSYTQKDMDRQGKNSLFAHRGNMLYRNEMIVYREDAANIKYLIEIC